MIWPEGGEALPGEGSQEPCGFVAAERDLFSATESELSLINELSWVARLRINWS